MTAKTTPKPVAADLPPADQLIQAAESIDRLATLFRHMVAASDALRAVGREAGTLDGLRAACADVRAEIGKQEAALAAVSREAEAARQQVPEVLRVANFDADAVRAAARLEADEIVAAARRESDRLSSSAATANAERVAVAEASLLALEEERKRVHAVVQQAEARRAQLAAEIEAMESRLVDARRAAAAIINPNTATEKARP